MRGEVMGEEVRDVMGAGRYVLGGLGLHPE